MRDIGISGRHFWRALAYAFDACPSSDASPRLSHVAFIGDKVIGSDGTRWHVGLLPSHGALDEPIVVARESVEELLIGLDYANRIAKRHSGPFQVFVHPERVVIKFGTRDKDQIEHDLILCKLGELPSEWKPPVSKKAPELKVSALHYGCGKVIEALKWYRSWEKDHGTFTFHADADAGKLAPFRIDITCDGEVVAQSYLLPEDAPPAQLPPDDPLFKGKTGPARSQSILDLDLSLKPIQSTDPKKRKKGKKGKKAEADAGNKEDTDEKDEAAPGNLQ
jgi:hypothetical protein